jgi:nuclear pore complex protein Nup62
MTTPTLLWYCAARSWKGIPCRNSWNVTSSCNATVVALVRCAALRYEHTATMSARVIQTEKRGVWRGYVGGGGSCKGVCEVCLLESPRWGWEKMKWFSITVMSNCVVNTLQGRAGRLTCGCLTLLHPCARNADVSKPKDTAVLLTEVLACVRLWMCVCLCMYVFVGMHVCMYVCMHVFVCIYMYVCLYVFICICIYVCVYMLVCIWIYVYVCICIYVYVCICVYVCVYVYSAHAHTHTHIPCFSPHKTTCANTHCVISKVRIFADLIACWCNDSLCGV